MGLVGHIHQDPSHLLVLFYTFSFYIRSVASKTSLFRPLAYVLLLILIFSLFPLPWGLVMFSHWPVPSLPNCMLTLLALLPVRVILPQSYFTFLSQIAQNVRPSQPLPRPLVDLALQLCLSVFLSISTYRDSLPFLSLSLFACELSLPLTHFVSI